MRKKKNNKKIITIDGLARLIQGEFLGVQQGFTEVHRKMDSGFNEVHRKMDERFNKVDDDINYIHGHLDVIELEIADIKKKLENVVYRHEFELLRERIGKIEKKLALR